VQSPKANFFEIDVTGLSICQIILQIQGNRQL
jgi:hypothetical protein